MTQHDDTQTAPRHYFDVERVGFRQDAFSFRTPKRRESKSDDLHMLGAHASFVYFDRTPQDNRASHEASTR
ncbi:MAG: hypothetical protein GEU79_16730 [Acidimicrobiia bacterium]|nr:hypothetical protein [Acidimicrobiia bacterium]